MLWVREACQGPTNKTFRTWIQYRVRTLREPERPYATLTKRLCHYPCPYSYYIASEPLKIGYLTILVTRELEQNSASTIWHPHRNGLGSNLYARLSKRLALLMCLYSGHRNAKSRIRHNSITLILSSPAPTWHPIFNTLEKSQRELLHRITNIIRSQSQQQIPEREIPILCGTMILKFGYTYTASPIKSQKCLK